MIFYCKVTFKVLFNLNSNSEHNQKQVHFSLIRSHGTVQVLVTE